MDFFLAGDGDGRNLFTDFALSSKPYTPAKLEKVNDELARNSTSAGQLLQSKTCSAIFLSDFSERVERILTWLNSLADLESGKSQQKRLGSQLPDIIYGFASSLVIPLLSPEYSECHSSRGFADLVVTTTHLSYVFRKRGVNPKTHKLLLEKIPQNGRYLMRSILPSLDGAKLIQTLLAEAQAGAEIQAVGSATTLAEWITAAAELCRGCSGNHGLHVELARWSALVELRDSLTKILLAENKRRSQPSGTIPQWHPDLTQLRVLSAEDKKSGNTNRQAAPELSDYLSPQDIKNLELFNLRVPTGLGPLEGVITSLQERESFSLFHVFVKSFPCALCLRRDNSATDPVPGFSQTAMPRKQFSVDSLPNSFTSTLLGRRLGPWKISLSERAFEDLLSANKEGYLSAIARRMKELASGQWDKPLRVPLSLKMREACGGNVPVPLWRAAYSSLGRILWQINVGYDEECETESQIITVWRIGPADEVRKYIPQVVQVQKTYTASHVQRCRERGGFPLNPEIYDEPLDDARSNTPQKHGDQGDAEVETTGFLMSNKFYSVTGKILDRIFSSPDEIEFPFDISREEIEIVKQANSAAFILGRSGTGKTTCLLFKLLCRNIASRTEQTPVRQIFLTRSSFLAERLKDYLRRLMESQLGNPSVRTEMQNQTQTEFILREARDPLEDETLDTLLGDDKFPLVCTFDQLFGFLEKVIKLNDRSNFDFLKTSSTPWDRGARRLIDYNVFSTQYCQRGYNDHKGGSEPDLILAEILGIIKGSTSAERDFRPLSRDEYVGMSTRKAPVFTDENSRNAVYTMYQYYEQRKRSFGDRDDIDRVTHLLKSLEKDPNLKTRVQALFDEVYVDEVQDNKLLEMDLLFTLVRNPYGIHFAGDTAQCISRDNTFRFEDIKARFYEHFISLAKKTGKLDCAKPELKTLPRNYRSHQGILSLAADIVDMLCNGFPGQIDVLPREVGNYAGVKPTMFVGFDHKILAQGNAGIPGTEQAMSDFGAEQVIIVKNDIVKAELKKVLASTLILTIYQSKGLEFEDVILYNFFSDSIWNNIRLPTLELLLNKESAVWFDKSRYAGLCSELKHLYVAVTRARKNLWIVEHNKPSVQNIVMLWTGGQQGREQLVSCVDVDDPEAKAKARTIIKPGKSTSPEAWRNQGEMLLQRALYEDAGLCFQKANYKQGEDLAKAYQLYETASRLDVGASSRQAKGVFAEAAQLFEDALFIQKAAETWGAAGKYKKAAEVLKAHKEFGKAALWYMRANDFQEAAQCYHWAEQHDEAVKAYRKGEHWAELLEYLEEYQEKISNSIKTRYSTLINLLLLRGDLKLPEALLPAALETLGDDNAKEEFYKKFEKTEDLFAFYLERKRYHDYFQLALREGKFQDSVRIGNASRVAKDTVSQVPPEDLLMLYNGIMAGYTWSSIQFDLNNLSEAKLPLEVIKSPTHTIPELGKTPAPDLRGPSSGWLDILDCLKGASESLLLPRQRQNIYSVKFFREFGHNFLNLVEFLHLDTSLRNKPLQATEMAQLPISTIQQFASLSGDLLSNRKPPTDLVTSIGGLMFSHLQDQVMILKWSPLFPIVSGKGSALVDQNGGNYEYVLLTPQETFNALSGWLVPIVAQVVPRILVHMHALLIERSQELCFVELQGSCRKQLEVCKTRRHTKLPSEEIRANISSLLDAAGLHCTSERLYRHHKFKESDSKLYRPKGRALLEKLLKELTYVSPLLNDSEMQQEFWGTILGENGNSKWPLVRDGLASLFFHRLRPQEWEKRGTVSALLEERSLANRLGVMPRFLQFLKYRGYKEGIYRKLNFITECNSLQLSEVARYDNLTLVQRISKVTEFIIPKSDEGVLQSTHQLKSFHSVLSLYEYLSLELINRILRVELLVPRSRLQFIRDPMQIPNPSDDERHGLERCLVQLLSDLCDLLLYFAKEYWRLKSDQSYSQKHDLELDSKPSALFFVCGRPLSGGNKYMVRRSLDHLTLCMINMGVERKILPAGYNKLFDKIKDVYEKWDFILKYPPTPVPLKGYLTPVNLALQLASAYRKYNKEELLIITRATTKGKPRFQFITIPKLRRVVVGEQQSTSTPGAQITLGKPQISELGDEETAASKITKWWRRCSLRLQAHRENALKRDELLSQGPAAQAEVIIDGIIVSWMTSRYRRHRNILRDRGVSLLSGILHLKVLAKSIHTTAMGGLGGKYKLSSMAVEDIQDIIGLLEKRRGLLEGTEAMFAERAEVQLFKMTAGKLEEKMDQALRLLETYRAEVNKWARNIENYLKEARGYQVN